MIGPAIFIEIYRKSEAGPGHLMRSVLGAIVCESRSNHKYNYNDSASITLYLNYDL